MSTQRLYSVLEKTRDCDRLVDHPRVLALLDRLFLPNYLLSQLQVINILPGENAQLLHHDDGFYPLPRPRPPVGAATVWAIDPFTQANGATVVIPGSHLWDDRRPTASDSIISVAMTPGSCVFFLGTLWHGGGANRSAHPRLAVTAQYCEPWLRPQEAFSLSTSRDCARHRLRRHPAHARLQHPPTLHRPGQRHAPRTPTRNLLNPALRPSEQTGPIGRSAHGETGRSSVAGRIAWGAWRSSSWCRACIWCGRSSVRCTCGGTGTS